MLKGGTIIDGGFGSFRWIDFKYKGTWYTYFPDRDTFASDISGNVEP